MVIFYSYVSLPEGNQKKPPIRKADGRLHSNKTPPWLCWLSPHMCSYRYTSPTSNTCHHQIHFHGSTGSIIFDQFLGAILETDEIQWDPFKLHWKSVSFPPNSETKLPAGLGSRAASGPEVNDVFLEAKQGNWTEKNVITFNNIF